MPPTTRPASANVPSGPDPATLVDAYVAHLQATKRRVRKDSLGAARSFLRRWPDSEDYSIEPLEVRLGVPKSMQCFVNFLLLCGHLRPGYDYLLARKFTRLWGELFAGTLGEDVSRFTTAAEELGFGVRTTAGSASQVMGRILLQTGKRLDELTDDDLAAFDAAVGEAQHQHGRPLRHYTGSAYMTRTVLYHLGILSEAPSLMCSRRRTWEQRMAGVPECLRRSFVAYLECISATQAEGTVTSRASRLGHFGRFLASCDPELEILSDLDRQAHIEPYLHFVTEAKNSFSGKPISIAERRLRIFSVRCMLEDIAEWGWKEAPQRRLIFGRDLPRLPRPLPRYLPPDDDRRLVETLEARPDHLVAGALLLQRACGLRIGELLDLELDCVHEIPDQGAWLKVPLGKLTTERMVPIDEETVSLVDRVVASRSPGRPRRHPRTGRPVDFLFTRHGRRLSPQVLRKELAEAAEEAGVEPVVPHQLRHTYATALVNAGCSLQALMALLGHVSAEMSLRYGRLFDQTVRENYERALAQAKATLGPVLPAATPVKLETNWREAPLIKARLAGGYCLRTPAQGSCAYANICEHCPNFRSEKTLLPVLQLQRVDAQALVADAEERGWGSEAARHRRLIERIDAVIEKADAAG